MAKNEGQFARISIIFPVEGLGALVEVEKNLKAALALLPEYRWDLQIVERKGGVPDGILGHESRSS